MTIPKFSVGDVVAYNDDVGHLILERVNPFKERVKLGCKGIIITLHDDCLNVGEFYTVSWFGGNGNSLNEVIELNLCKGISKPQLCDKCKDKVECQSHVKTCQNCR
ncbi:hypothetical protein ACFLX4_01080 [Chloroflexota bacterium]